MSSASLRLGTRGSQLALWQAHAVAERIAASGGPPCEIVIIKTSGDRLQDAPLSQAGGKRLFVKEIEDALLRNTIDLAVHSSKDMPAELPAGLTIAAVLPREDPLDAVVLPATVRMKADATGALRADTTYETGSDSDATVVSGFSQTARNVEELLALLGPSPAIGTGSVRRVTQLSRLFPGARFTPIRGNLDTRLKKLDSGEHDALVLAAAGLKRLGFGSRISMTFDSSICVPAPGQGIVAIETRSDDTATRNVIQVIEDSETRAALDAERAVVTALGAGCQTPVGALASPVAPREIEVAAVVLSLDGRRVIRASRRGPIQDAALIGNEVGNLLIAEGADEILAESNAQLSTFNSQP